jgi:hypothetical protein
VEGVFPPAGFGDGTVRTHVFYRASDLAGRASGITREGLITH